MRQMQMFGGKVYNNQQFKDHMNGLYYPVDNMKKSVAALKASGEIDIETMEYGYYQPILSPLAQWPSGKGNFWMREMGKARMQLAALPNSAALSQDESGVVPLTKCALLDCTIRKCFNSDPPIPIIIDVTERAIDDPDSDKNDIRLVWEYDSKSEVPNLLRLTMVCPAKS